MWKPWAVAQFVGAQLVGAHSHEVALANARGAATELSRLRVQRVEIEQYVARRAAQRPSKRAEQPA